MGKFDIGGALSGAGAGAQFGPWGAAGGAALGALGIFGGDSPQLPPSIQYNPANVTTGAGSLTFDQGTNQFTGALDPRLQGIQDQMFGAGGGFLGELSTFNPDQYAANVSDRLRSLAAPQEEQQRLALENRNFQQGLFNSSTGGQRTQDLLTAQAQAENQRNLQAFTLSQDVQGNLLNRGLQAYGAGINLEQLPLQLAELSQGAGRGNLGADITNQSNIWEANKLAADTSNAFGGALLGGFGELAGAFGGGGASGTSLGTSLDNWWSGTDFTDEDLNYFNSFDIGE